MSAGSIRVEGVTVAYDREPAVSRISGHFSAGSLTAIAGPNGAGKTTLLKALMDEVPLLAGTVDRGGLSTRDFGYLPQLAEIDRSFPISVADVVALGAWRETGAFGAVGREAATRAREALATLGLEGLERRTINSLSAGQLQRVLFARLLLQDASVILLDEPFTAVDARTTGDLLAIVRRWHQEKRTVIAVLHNFEQVRSHFPDTLLIAREMIAWGPTATTMTEPNLLRARAIAERWEEEPAPIPLRRSAA